MKTLFIIPLVLMSLVSFPSWGLTMDDLVQREGLYFQKFTDVPFTGEVDEGLKRGVIINGKKEGSWKNYHSNGQLKKKLYYKNDLRTGTFISYFDNGQLNCKGAYKTDKYDGPLICYHKNGQLSLKATFVEGS